MGEETVIITNRELVDYTLLTRKKNENEFRHGFLLRNGAKEDDFHVRALGDLVGEIEAKLKPIREKLEVVDLVAIVPRRKEIEGITSEINSHSKAELDEAITKKAGDVYGKMKQRAALTRGNFDRREDIARLTVLANSLPRSDCEALCRMVESSEGEAVDVGTLSEGKRKEISLLAARLGCRLNVDGTRLVRVELQKEGAETERTIVGRGSVWVANEKLAEFDENEKKIGLFGRQMQERTAQRQVRTFEGEEQKAFDELQRQYIVALDTRGAFIESGEERVVMARRGDGIPRLL
ncbi:hypothetical protein J4441_01325 [Candidatus Micrarchaeota archaeon]|nr:hypothetical protein [Candidatus Micrarchaeota archaeon]